MKKIITDTKLYYRLIKSRIQFKQRQVQLLLREREVINTKINNLSRGIQELIQEGKEYIEDGRKEKDITI